MEAIRRKDFIYLFTYLYIIIFSPTVQSGCLHFEIGRAESLRDRPEMQ